MKKYTKTIILLFAVIAVASLPYFYTGKCKSCNSPVIALGSVFGCSEAKQNNADKTETSVNNKSTDHKVTFVEIGSVNCIPCKMMQPIIKEIETEYAGQVKVIFHDVWTDQGKQDAMKYGGIRMIPTQIFLDNKGIEFFRHEGYFPKEELIKILKRQGVE